MFSLNGLSVKSHQELALLLYKAFSKELDLLSSSCVRWTKI